MDLDYEVQREAFMLAHLSGQRYDGFSDDEKRRFIALAEREVHRQRKERELRTRRS